MTATLLDQQVTIPGTYDIPADVYHRDPVPGGSLSSSGARKLLPPHCPARFAYERANPNPPTKAFDLGHAAHKLVLGVGPELVLFPGTGVNPEAWQRDDDKAAVAALRAEGKVPLKPSDWDTVHAMAAAIREHPVANALFDPDTGQAERSLFWVDRQTGVWRRALLDWLPGFESGRRTIFADYKTTRSASPEHLRRTIDEYGYNQQAAWYLDGAQALGLAAEAAFVFVCQEKDPPHLVTVAEPDSLSMLLARDLNRRAIDLYAKCAAEDRWPGYGDDVELIPLPGWKENAYKWELNQQ